MRIGLYERVFLVLTLLVLAGSIGAVSASVLADHATLPGPVGRVDPATLRETPPFDEPGLRETGQGTYEAVLVAFAWGWEPEEITVPAGSEVTFITSSVDVIHGLKITGTNVNAMVIPGQITAVTARFDTPGEHLLICHEYCGLGHHVMAGKVVVE